jgi:hypothetical protein
MEETIRLTSEDNLVLEPILDLISRRSGRKRTLEDLSSRWSRFVTKVEQGYKLTIDDYTNELTTRDFYQVLLDNCAPNIHDKLLVWINSWDERFIHTTEKVEKPLLPALHGEKGWWWFRIPLNPGKAMKQDLQTWWS